MITKPIVYYFCISLGKLMFRNMTRKEIDDCIVLEKIRNNSLCASCVHYVPTFEVGYCCLKRTTFSCGVAQCEGYEKFSN